MPKLRYQPPDRLPGATDFSKDDALRGSVNAVRLVKSQPWVWDGLRDACAALESGYARKREPGHWELVPSRSSPPSTLTSSRGGTSPATSSGASVGSDEAAVHARMATFARA